MSKPRFASALQEIVRPGRIVHGLTASPMRVVASNVVGYDVAVTGQSLGKDVVVKFRATSSLVHRLAFENHRGIQRLASIVMWAAEGKFSVYVNESIRQHGFPVDPKMNWDAYINKLYGVVSPKNPDLREDAIYYVIVTNLYNRDYLKGFNEEKSPLPTDAPLEEKVTQYLKTMFRYRVSEAIEYCQGQFVMDKNQAEKYDVAPGGYSLDSGGEGDTDYSQHHTLVNDSAHTDREIDMELREFRTKFQQWLSKKKGPTEAELMMKLFNASIAIGDRDFSELQKRWEVIAPGKSVSYMAKLLRQLGELLEDFAATGQVPGFERLIKRQKQRLEKSAPKASVASAKIAGVNFYVDADPDDFKVHIPFESLPIKLKKHGITISKKDKSGVCLTDGSNYLWAYPHKVIDHNDQLVGTNTSFGKFGGNDADAMLGIIEKVYKVTIIDENDYDNKYPDEEGFKESEESDTWWDILKDKYGIEYTKKKDNFTKLVETPGMQLVKDHKDIDKLMKKGILPRRSWSLMDAWIFLFLVSKGDLKSPKDSDKDILKGMGIKGKLAAGGPGDPEIHVKGYGIVSLSWAKAKVLEYIEMMDAFAKADQFEKVQYLAQGNGVLKAMLEAILKAEKEMPVTAPDMLPNSSST